MSDFLTGLNNIIGAFKPIAPTTPPVNPALAKYVPPASTAVANTVKTATTPYTPPPMIAKAVATPNIPISKTIVNPWPGLIQGINSDIASLGMSTINAVFPGTVPQKLSTESTPYAKFLFGPGGVQTVEQNAKDIQTMLEPHLGKTIAGNLSMPLALGGILLDLSNFGGEKAVVSTAEKTIPEAFFKNMAAEENPITIKKTLTSIGMDDTRANALAPKMAATQTTDEAKQVWKDFHAPKTPIEAPKPETSKLPLETKPTSVHKVEPPVAQSPVVPTPPETQTLLPEPPEDLKTLKNAPPPELKNKVDLKIKGDTEAQKVRSVIGNSESIRTQITNRGQEGYTALRGLSPHDIKLAEGYDQGISIDTLAQQADNPLKFKTAMAKATDYYDFRLSADRASGGGTGYESAYLPHEWDLNNPEDLAKFNHLAIQRGLKPYEGFKSQPRLFGTYAHGESLGFKRKNPNIAEDLKSDYTKASDAIGLQVLREGLKEVAPEKVNTAGYGRTEKGRPFLNSNLPGLEGLSMHPAIAQQLKGYTPLAHPDFVRAVIRDGAEAVVDKTGLAGEMQKWAAGLKSIPANAKEAGLPGVAGSIYDHVSDPMKQVLWNWSGFHSLNITLSQMGASIFHPIIGAKGVVQSVASLLSEKMYQASIENYKNIMVTDSEGVSKSVYDWAVDSGALKSRDLPKTGLARANPFTISKQGIFSREIPILQLSLAEQVAKKGIPANSPQGRAVGAEIQAITGEIDPRKMNLNPNTIKAGSRLFLAPGFTYSKFKVVFDSLAKWGKEYKEAGNLARTAFFGKSLLVGLFVILGTKLATGKYPNLEQIFKDFTYDPSMQTNITNAKGQKKDVTLPKTFISELGGMVTDPIHYAEARLAPLISDTVKLVFNKDYYGNPIVDPNVKESAMSQRMKNLGVGTLPVGAQAVVKQFTGKQSWVETAIQILGGGTRINKDDPTMVYYKAIDDAQNAINRIAPDDANRTNKIQTIYNSLTLPQRKSLNYALLLAGVSTKGVLSSDAGRVKPLYDKLMTMAKNGQKAEAGEIWNKLSDADKLLFNKITTYYKTVATNKAKADFKVTYDRIQTLKDAGQIDQAKKEWSALTPAEKKYFEELTKQNL